MIDMNKLLELFSDFGIPNTVTFIDGKYTITLLVESHEKVIGYSYFRSEYNFDEDGKFINVGIWE